MLRSACSQRRSLYFLCSRNKKTLPIINVTTNHKYVKKKAEWNVEAGIRLFGSEVRSFREKLCDISAAYVTASYQKFEGEEKCKVNLHGCVIPVWRNLYHDTRREITLLVTKKDAKRLSEYEQARVYHLVRL
uniref:Uncharacterized protein n=1 Tax=Vannella robusta TaxID=1487602 RepID=A0A7S4I079_9EUKA|mmetsp:Transcript_18446/g.23376  ORF Transcript_18446/g.23376 Transcript_18446/m.23376 type:complete len:132 (+) Transcript_18446:79-474(+)